MVKFMSWFCKLLDEEDGDDEEGRTAKGLSIEVIPLGKLLLGFRGDIGEPKSHVFICG